MKRILNAFKTVFSLDLRSLALMRVSVGLILLYDTLDRARFLKDHYTDWGLLPRRLVTDHLIQERMSVHFISGEWYFQALIFVFTLLCVFAMLIGYKTRLATALTWVLVFSSQNRVDWLNYSADVVARLVLLWAIFIPWGAKFSVDSAFDDRPKSKPDTVFSAATVGFVIQFCFFYTMAGFLKTGDQWADGTATYYALALDDFVRPLGVFARQYHEVLVWLTKSVLIFEKFGCILLLIPFKFAIFRLIGMFGFLNLQIGFANFLHVGIFPFISTAFMLGLTPRAFWVVVGRKVVRKQYAAVHIYYQGMNSVVHRLFRLYQTFFLPPDVRVAPVQILTEEPKDLLKGRQFFVIDSVGIRHHGANAIELIFQASPILFPLAKLMRFSKIEGFIERFLRTLGWASDKGWVREKLAQPARKFRFYPGWAGNSVAVFMIIVISLWNWGTLPEKKNYLPIPLQKVALRLGLDQRWSMFAPYPRSADGWFVMPGELRDGTKIDIRTKEPVSWDRPKDYAGTITNDRWRKYYENYSYNQTFNEFRMDYGKYLCREWNSKAKFQKQLMKFEIYLMREDELSDYKVDEVRKNLYWNHFCFDEVAPPDVRRK